MRPGTWAAALVALAVGVLGTTGCTTNSFCFTDCAGQTDGGTDTGNAGDSGHDAIVFNEASDGPIFNFDGGQDGDACVKQNGGVEQCDGLDDDCNGIVDDVTDKNELSKPTSCGTCQNDCTKVLIGAIGPTCTPPSKFDGNTPGTCGYTKCDPDYRDKDGNPANGCEYQCPFTPVGPEVCDNQDNNCDGQVDEGFNLCTDTDNCGKCGHKCVIANGTPKCTSTATGSGCNSTNTTCGVLSCDPGYYDIDGSPDNGCEYKCTPTNGGKEICDGIDNNCDGKIDNVDPALVTDDPNVGQDCYGGTQGECAAATHKGVSKCIGGQVQCCDVDSNNVPGTNPNLPVTGLRNGVCKGGVGPFVLKPGQNSETCDGLDNDCNGIVDDNTGGAVCGVSVGNCVSGTMQCISGQLKCTGSSGPQTELCNGQDDDCDGVIDGTIPSSGAVSCTKDSDCASGQLCLVRSGPTDKVCATPPSDSVGDCDVPPPPPSGATQPCKKGALRCVGGVKTCQGSIGPTSTTDTCGVDANCDGTLNNQPDLKTDVHNCGSCGNDCYAGGNSNGVWACQAGKCVRTACQTGYVDCDSFANGNTKGDGTKNTCETQCTVISSTEQCDGKDDNCNCLVDDNVVTPSPTQVCDVAAGATDPGCTAGAGPTHVQVTCSGGGWKCTFPTDYCNNAAGPDYCSSTQDVCDGKDNNCNGATDESFKPPLLTTGYLGEPCSTPASDGACQGIGQYVCNGTNATKCNAVKDNSKAGPELCDGIDNDCDGLVDEPKSNPGSNAAYYVQPAVTRLSSGVFIYQYEASRPGATATDPGSGNGFQTAAPAGTPLDKTQSCSVAGVVPWFNITATEAAQTCIARGGRLCQTSDWETACHATNNCTRGYAPHSNAACKNDGTYGSSNSRICNIGPFDFDGNPSNGIQDGLLPTAYTGSFGLYNCWADWSGTSGNTSVDDNIRDIEGNLRELTYNTSVSPGGCSLTNPAGTCLFSLMGGAFNTQSEDGAACDFTFYTVDNKFKLFDTGFRCCFDSNPD